MLAQTANKYLLTIRQSRSDMIADVFFLMAGTDPGFKYFLVPFS